MLYLLKVTSILIFYNGALFLFANKIQNKFYIRFFVALSILTTKKR